ncbi:MAG: hypothetical protein E3J76_01150 [Candidatus Aminicenantes bacterium]|nr:MAG: hypothetical protein E3J76_01150 [Candidatus Aminicenantes bacterium]
MNYKNETSEAIKRVERIIQKWEEHWLDSREALELLVPDLKTIICYFEKIQDPEKGVVIEEKGINNQEEKEEGKEGEKEREKKRR